MEKLGILFCGSGGAVASTAIAGLALLRAGLCDETGLPLSGVATSQLIPYGNLECGGWDLFAASAGMAVRHHEVVPPHLAMQVARELEEIRPFPAIAFEDSGSPVQGAHLASVGSRREAVDLVRRDISNFRLQRKLRRCVMINVASVERIIDTTASELADLGAFEAALDANSATITPSMIYAYAALKEGLPYANFTPSAVLDAPALRDLARQAKLPIAGKDGKTGQTFLKTVVAPAFRSRNLVVDGWYSANLLGNRDGLALSDPRLKESKINTKSGVLDSILGYQVRDHIVDITYYRPRGDNKESWDNIDIRGFLGMPMQIKINFLCRDSVLAAPLVIEIARLLDLAQIRGESGVQEQLSSFFKAPYSADAGEPPGSFSDQDRALKDWLAKSVGQENLAPTLSALALDA